MAAFYYHKKHFLHIVSSYSYINIYIYIYIYIYTDIYTDIYVYILTGSLMSLTDRIVHYFVDGSAMNLRNNKY